MIKLQGIPAYIRKYENRINIKVIIKLRRNRKLLYATDNSSYYDLHSHVGLHLFPGKVAIMSYLLFSGFIFRNVPV